ncbi:MAG: hypothetical protein KJ888_20785, partial [Gammaproteobacteria bacterium]|nr:hypothetical protein [Gammaproteobacteria bacterium]
GIKTKTEYHRDRRTGRHERLEYVDADEEKIVLFAEALNNFIIADWALFTNDGKKIDCTKENKNKLMRGSPRFAEFIAECTEQLRKDIRIQEDKELKNSENISID